uniref:EGF-like domain-containing protein n=1 Tax=Trichobilharzia regenti TaxID=157069 RepID=A0AA85JF78_TRIRE|nr:unnamed protein product [Trichobilharzia regenti]
MVLLYISFLIKLSIPSSLTVTHTEKLPHFALRGFMSTNDILYFHFSVPHHTFSSKLSVSANFHDCLPEDIIFTLRAGSLPVVRPFNVSLPNGVVSPGNTYAISVPAMKPSNQTFAADDCGTYSFFYVKSTNLRNAANAEIDIKSPKYGLWYVGVYMTISLQKECIAWLLPSVRHDISSIDGFISYSENIQSKLNYSTPFEKPVGESSTNFPSQSTLDSRVSKKLFHRKKRRKPLYRSAIHSTADQPKHGGSIVLPSPSNEPMNSGSQDSGNLFIISPFDLELSPMENRLYTLPVMDEMTSIDFVLEECRIVTPIAPSLGNISESKRSNPNLKEASESPSNNDLLSEMISDPSLCPVIVDASAGAVPLSLSNLDQPKVFGILTENKSDSREDTSLNAGGQPSNIFNRMYQSGIQRTFRLLGLRGSQVEHYVYILNRATHVAVYVRLAVVPKFGFSVMRNSRNFRTEDYIPLTIQSKLKKDSLQLLLLLSTSDNKSSKEKLNSGRLMNESNTNLNYRQFMISLLPWINSNWPELTPEYGEKKWIRIQSSNNIVNNYNNNNNNSSEIIHSNFDTFNSEHPGYQNLPLCFIWPQPSRVQLPMKFTYHFTYQPDFGRYASLLHLKPWHVVAIPITLNAVTDVSSVLEIAVQLNALNVSWQYNETYREPLPRQIILHGCFAQHLTNTPKGFTDPRQCPLWIRLATDHGLAVSVAHATSSAVFQAFASSQSPRRSERPPNFDTSFREDVDRSFFYFPYPSPGLWYLSIYPECYTAYEAFCGFDQSAVIDVSLIIRSTPCINNRCRQIGEGASLAPSRLLYPNNFKENISTARDINQRWRPPWWSNSDYNNDNIDAIPDKDKLTASNYDSPFKPIPIRKRLHKIPGEGICINLFQRSIHVSTCACPIGYAGLGCMPLPIKYFHTFGLNPQRQILSYDAILLSLSNFGFIPAILLSVIHRLWIPALVYGYTFLFSTLYHICDTDSNLIPGYTVMHTPGFDGTILHQSTDIGLKMNIPIKKAFAYSQFASPICVLPVDTLSFCDFFGGIFSIWISILTAAALPMKYAHCAFILGALSLTVAVQVVRYSVGIFLVPLLLGSVILFSSWINICYKLKALFPPIQWWIVGFIPGVLFACIGASMFFNGQSPKEYTKSHSTWHILIGLSLACFLPWSFRWRIALSPIIAVHIPLSCGTLSAKYEYDLSNTSNSNSLVPVDEAVPEEAGIITSSGLQQDNSNTTNSNNNNANFPGEYIVLPKIAYKSSIILSRIFDLSSVISQCALRTYQKFTSRLDELLQLNFILDPVCSRWPKLKWILPYGYKSETTISVSAQAD